ncbi:YcjF family protein [Kangiella sp. HZ709]|uniref:YcjF family protein n=1 Tax=Kangiella sp. HZ709 TaxID=2666328 RepID=UPI0012B0F303|nr:TIGR01620 family protein [Kangiella sp. HZ709]MRX28473.1 TIGR01620 family protein [Kangiella sp. HZ709]
MSDQPIKFDSQSVKVETSQLDDAEQVKEDLLQEQQKSLPISANGLKLKKSAKSNRWLKWFGISFGSLVVTAAIFESWQFIQELFAISRVLGITVAALLVSVVIAGFGTLISGRIKSKRLEYRKSIQQKLSSYSNNETYGKAAKVLDEVSDEFLQEVDISKTLALYRQTANSSHNDSELIQIYNNQVLNGLDQLALEAIRKHATESALMVALSPLAIADMALVAWRSSRMLQDISRIYGCPQTAFGRLGLTKQVATNLMLAGASEFVAEAGVELLGKSVAAAISSKMAQGIGVGILISRLGIQTMQICRPIEFDEDNKPKLGQIRKSITNKILSMVKKNDKTLNKGKDND